MEGKRAGRGGEEGRRRRGKERGMHSQDMGGRGKSKLGRRMRESGREEGMGGDISGDLRRGDRRYSQVTKALTLTLSLEYQ